MDKLYYVEWWDHSSSDHWYDTEETLKAIKTRKPMLCKSIGWYLGETKLEMIFCSLVAPNQNGARMAILKSAIKKKKVVKLG